MSLDYTGRFQCAPDKRPEQVPFAWADTIPFLLSMVLVIIFIGIAQCEGWL